MEGGPAQEHSVSLSSAAASIDGTRQLIEAAAERAGEALDLPPATVTIARGDLVRLSRLSVEEGSFVWRLDLPVFLEDQLSLFGVRRPFGRLVVMTVLESLFTLTDIGFEDSWEPLTALPLEEPLRRIFRSASGAAVDWRFALAEVPEIEQPSLQTQSLEPVTFEASHVARLNGLWDERLEFERERFLEQSRSARRRQRAHIEVRGPVLNVAVDHATIRAEVEGRTLRVRVPLTENDLRTATDALIVSGELIASGDIIVTQRAARMFGPMSVRRA